MPAPVNVSYATATPLGALPATVAQTVDFSGTTYTVYYSFVAPRTGVTGAWAFGDLVTYNPTLTVFTGDVSGPTAVVPGGAVSNNNRPIQFPITAGNTYWLVITPNFGNPTPAALTLNVQMAPALIAPAGSLAVPDDRDGFPLALLSGTVDFTALNYVQPFPAGESADSLTDGTVLASEDTDNTLHLFNAQYQGIGTSAAQSATVRIRACLAANKFYIGVNSNPSKFLTCSSAGVFSAATTLTAMTSIAALAASNDEVTLYHAFIGTNQAIRRWTIGTGATTDLVAGIANYVVSDILVLGDGTLIVGYYKSTVTRDFLVKHYSAAGATLNTYTFALPAATTTPRLAYAINDPTSFWAWTHPASVVGQSVFANITVSDGSVPTTRVQEEFEVGAYGGAVTATPVARFGCSFSCPFWILRAAVAIDPPDPNAPTWKLIGVDLAYQKLKGQRRSDP